MLKDMVDRFVADRYGFEARQAILHSPAGWSRQVWSELAELGLLMTAVAEADGGLGGGGVELMIVSEALGRGLVGEPWLASLVSAAVIGCAADEWRAALLPAFMSGELLFALADDSQALTRDGQISGIARSVGGAGSADRLLVKAVNADGECSLSLIDAAGPGVSRDDFPVHGGTRAAHVTLDHAPVLGELLNGEAARRALVEARSVGVLATAADALGAAQATFDLTVDYLKTRVQFGQPLGANQALQHRAAEMFVELEQLRSAAILSACTLRDEDEAERARASAAVRIVTAKAARFIGQQAIQLHGGIGVTDEHAVGHYFLRLTAASMLFGDADENIGRLADAGGYVQDRPYWETN